MPPKIRQLAPPYESLSAVEQLQFAEAFERMKGGHPYLPLSLLPHMCRIMNLAPTEADIREVAPAFALPDGQD